MREYVALVTVNAMAAGRFVALIKGERLLLTPEEADDLLRVEYVEAIGKNAREVITSGAPKVITETAAIEPDETATAPAQEGKRRKGTAA